jgi:hypothetical protein
MVIIACFSYVGCSKLLTGFVGYMFGKGVYFADVSIVFVLHTSWFTDQMKRPQMMSKVSVHSFVHPVGSSY